MVNREFPQGPVCTGRQKFIAKLHFLTLPGTLALANKNNRRKNVVSPITTSPEIPVAEQKFKGRSCFHGEAYSWIPSKEPWLRSLFRHYGADKELKPSLSVILEPKLLIMTSLDPFSL